MFPDLYLNQDSDSVYTDIHSDQNKIEGVYYRSAEMKPLERKCNRVAHELSVTSK